MSMPNTSVTVEAMTEANVTVIFGPFTNRDIAESLVRDLALQGIYPTISVREDE